MTDEYREDNYENRATLTLCYGMRILVLLAAGLAFWWGETEASISTLFIFILMMAPYLLRRRYGIHLPFALDLGIVGFIFLTLFLGHMGSFYDYIPFWDKFVHFQSGILLGASGFVLVYMFNENKRTKLNLTPFFISVFAVAFSIAVGAIWEIVEFAGDSITGSAWQANNTDTMYDLIADALGAVFVSTIGYFWMHRHKRLPLTPWFIKFFRNKK